MSTFNRRKFVESSAACLLSTKAAIAGGEESTATSLTHDQPRGHSSGTRAFGNHLIAVDTLPDATTLWQIRTHAGIKVHKFSPPIVALDGRQVALRLHTMRPIAGRRLLPNGAEEYAFVGDVADVPHLTLRTEFQLHPESSVLRFRYIFQSSAEHTLDKPSGTDSLTYFGTSFEGLPFVKEIQLSQFVELTHSYQLAEFAIGSEMWPANIPLMGPIIAATNGRESFLVAYEHGSQVPDAFLQYTLTEGHSVQLNATKGNYLNGQTIGSASPFHTPWFEAGATTGGMDELASAFRRFILRYQSQNLETRKPYIFYNTWQFQTDNRWDTGKGYLDSMREERILQGIDVAHRLGIDVFVLDTGWYDKTGEWRVNTERFTAHLQKVKQALDQRGMLLGLWFGPTTAAVSSKTVLEHPEWRMSFDGKRKPPARVWETEESYQMCMVSGYGDAFANELIRIAQETGVRYFKWDAIHQGGCNDPHHSHGNDSNTPTERGDSYAFQLVQKMSEIADKVAEGVPDSIVDCDVTEGGRAMGLGFLASGKYFLMNNGPYLNNYDLPLDRKTMDANLFHRQGQARTWIARSALTYDRWIPSVLFLTHYLPAAPLQWQKVNVASLILGQNGIWGDLVAIPDAGVRYIGSTLNRYKQVRDDITSSDPVTTGVVSGSPEVREKIFGQTGKGVVVLFATKPGKYIYVTRNRARLPSSEEQGVRVEATGQGRARIEATFTEAGAKIVFFGVA